MHAITKGNYLNRTEDLTLDELKEMDSFKEMDDEQLQELLDTIKVFSKLVCKAFTNEQQKEIPVIHINKQSTQIRAA